MNHTFSKLFFLSSLLVSVGCALPRAGEDDGASSSTEAAAETVPTVTFAADYSESVSSTLRAGGKVTIAYDPSRLTTCRGTEGGRPQYGISLVWRLNRGDGATSSTAIDGVMAPVDNRVTIDLPRSGDLEMWFVNTSKYGCIAYDSDYGKNYHFRVEPSANAPDWMGNAASVVSRLTCDGLACDSTRRPLDEGFVFDTWARQRALVTGAYFDVWKNGVTDYDNPDLWKLLDARVHYRAAGATTWSWAYVSFEKRVGNDARYMASLRAIDPLGGRTRTTKEDCPAATLTVSADGMYVTTEVELFFSVNGNELRPANRPTWKGTFSDRRDLYRPCL